MEVATALLAFAAITFACWANFRFRRDRAKLTVEARLWGKPDGTAPVSIEIRNFGPRTARIDRLVIDSKVKITGDPSLGKFEGNSLDLIPLQLCRFEVTFIDATIAPYINAKAVWMHGIIVETGKAWSLRAELLRS